MSTSEARQPIGTDSFEQLSFLQGANAAYVEMLYARYAEDKSSVDEAWQSFFGGLEEADADPKANAAGASWQRCGTFALQYMHISDPEESQWLKERIEGRDKEVSFTPEGRKAILNKLVETEGFEKFLNVKYTGTKRFGIDGGSGCRTGDG